MEELPKVSEPDAALKRALSDDDDDEALERLDEVPEPRPDEVAGRPGEPVAGRRVPVPAGAP